LWDGVVTDITGRKRAEEALRRSESDLRKAQEIAKLGSWNYDLADGTLSWSEEMFRMFGVSPETFMPNIESLIHLIHSEDRSAMLAWIAACEAGEKPGELEFRAVLPDGTVRVISGRGELVHSADGRPAHLSGTANDITERRLADEGLHLARFCIDHAAIGIFRIEEDGRIVEVNDQACSSLGYSREDLCTRMVFDIDPDLTREWWFEHRLGLMSDKGSKTIETHHRRKDGSIYPVEVTINYLEYAGRPLAYSFVTDITERKYHEEQLRHLATHDELTGLANRTLLLDRLEQTMHYARRSGRLVAVMLLDLDRFKVVNDSLGHAFGDMLLCSVAQRLKQSVREADTVARLGGDEFVILLAEVAEVEDAGLVAAKILRLLAEPHRLDDREITLTASLGVSLFPRDSDDGPTLIRNADTAMYRAKRNESSTFVFYSPEMNQRIRETLELEGALRQALEREEFCLHYQPKVDLASGRVIGCEALVRWHHPQRGMVSPADFIPLAEETGLIVPLGTWVLKEACRQAKAWQTEGLPSPSVAVNLSARQFRTGNLPRLLQEILQDTHLNPDLLELELTESMVMDDPAAAERTMFSLKDLGVKLSLDDFGTGYSSLNYLRWFPVDSLKIDRSFIRDVATDPSGASVVTSVIDIAHNLGLTAVAEGVETREQLAFLTGCGCDILQGYLFSKPLPPEEFTNLLREGRQLAVG
jgi:diguanylate cyclase (GGDEF)-like protein/PAS domain S-box-containing protein